MEDRWVAWKGRGRVREDTTVFEFRLGCRFTLRLSGPLFLSLSLFLSSTLSFSELRRLSPTYVARSSCHSPDPTFDLARESLVLRRIRDGSAER